MKKLLCLLCAVLMITQFFGVTVMAQPEENDVIFGLSAVVGDPGETVVVELKMESQAQWNSLAVMNISFDAEVLSFVGFENYEKLKGEAIFSAFDSEKGVITAAFMSPVKYSGKVTDLVFVIKENAKHGADSEVNVETLVKFGPDALVSVVNAGSVTVCDSDACEHERRIEIAARSADCLRNGNHKYFICDSCEMLFKADGITETTAEEVKIPALGHDLSAADCVSPEMCQREGCGYVSGSALGHSFTAYKSNNDATCTADGTRTAKCDRCDATDTVADTGSAKGHSFVGDTCSVCGYEKAHTHIMTKTEGKAATCTEAGNVEYFTCSGCGKRFADDKGEAEIDDVALPALNHSFTDYKSNNDATCTADGTKTAKCDRCDVTDTVADTGSAKGHSFENDTCSVCGFAKEHVHSMVKTEAVAATCHQNGNQEYWYCADCDSVFSDAEGRYLTNRKNVVIPATKGLTYVPAAEGCHVPGSAEYWYCVECEAVFADAAGTVLTNRKNLETAPVSELTHVAAVEATCHQNGSAEYWYCAKCEGVFADAEGKQLTNVKNLTVPATKGLTYVPAAEGCHVPGTAEYWYCVECEAVFADAAGTVLTNRKNLETAPTCELGHMDAVEPCHNNGTLEYWFCPKCEAVFADAEGRQLTNRMNLTVPAVEGALQHFEAVAPTKDKDGVQEHWYCEGCDCYFTDAEGKYNVAYKSLILPAIETPKTGDTVMVWVVLAVVSVMGMACTVALNKKKFGV